MQETGNNWQTYRLYDVTLSSNFPFANLRPVAAAPPDVVFSYGLAAPFVADWQAAAALYSPPLCRVEGGPFFTLLRLAEGCEVLRFHESADFYLWPDRIYCHLLNAAEIGLAELYLLGVVLANWAEGQGIAMMHAAAVVTERGAIGFLAASGTGKSSLAAAFVRAGFPLLADDLLAIRYRDERVVASPGYPQMRLWPEQAQRFVGGTDGLRQVYFDETKLCVPVGDGRFGSFCPEPRPLVAAYLPRRREPEDEDDSIEIQSIPPAELLFTLVAHSFASRMTNTLQRQRQRLTLLTPLALRVPVRRLLYPSGYEHLPRVIDALLADVAALAADPLTAAPV